MLRIGVYSLCSPDTNHLLDIPVYILSIDDFHILWIIASQWDTELAPIFVYSVSRRTKQNKYHVRSTNVCSSAYNNKKTIKRYIGYGSWNQRKN